MLHKLNTYYLSINHKTRIIKRQAHKNTEKNPVITDLLLQFRLVNASRVFTYARTIIIDFYVPSPHILIRIGAAQTIIKMNFK